MKHVRTSQIDWYEVQDKPRAARTALAQSTSVDQVRIERVYQERAARLAAPPSSRRADAKGIPVLVVRSGGETYGIELQDVAQVFPDKRITPVPGAPEPVLGIADFHGDIRSVLGLRRLVGLFDGDETANCYVLLLRHDGREVGLRVELIDGIRELAPDVVNAPDMNTVPPGRCLRGVTSDNLIVLRTDAIVDYSSLKGDRVRDGSGSSDSMQNLQHQD